jgi:hypothetical protein
MSPPRPKSLPYSQEKNFNVFKNLILSSYVESQAHVMASMLSPPKIKNPFRYNLAIKVFLDDDELE